MISRWNFIFCQGPSPKIYAYSINDKITWQRYSATDNEC